MKKITLSLTLAAFAISGAWAEEAPSWKHQLTPYMLGAAMGGDVTVKGVSASVDMPFSDIWSNLEFGAMMNYRAERDRLSLGLDVIYMGLGGTSPGGLAHLDFDQWMVEGNAGWRVGKAVEIIGGLRYNDLAAKIRTQGTQPRNVAKGKSWTDPFVGGRVILPLSGALALVGRGDIGGFGVGSDLAWGLAAYLRYAPSSNVAIVAGYRYFDMDYEDGEGADLFVYDMTTQGPVLGFTWVF